MSTRRRVAIAAAVVGVAGLLAATLLVLPGVLADRLERDGAACRDAIRATGLGDPRACPTTVAFRGITPGDRDHATEVEAYAHAETALLVARVAAVRDLDEPARDRALHDVAELPKLPGVDLFEEAFELGANRTLVELASDPIVARRDPSRAARYGMHAALVLGDREALVRIARWAVATPEARELDDDVAALACVAGLACQLDPARAGRRAAEIENLLAGDDTDRLANVLALAVHQPEQAASWWSLAPTNRGLDPERARRLVDRIAARVPAPRAAAHDPAAPHDAKRDEARPADDPVATALLHGAWAHAVIAAQLYALAGDADAAKRALWRSEELAGDLRFGEVDDLATAAARGLVSPTPDALQWLVEIHDRSREPRVRARLRHMQAMLLVETGRFGDALAALGRCRHDATCDEERWTRIAAAMLARQPIQPRSIPWPTDPSRLTDDRWCPELLRAPDTVPSLIVAPASDRARARWGCRGSFDMDAGKVALPEWLYVAGWLAGDHDPEPWLDTLAPDVTVRRWQRARELAARWRGDSAAADAWKRRRESTEAIVAAHPGLAADLGI